MPTGLCAGVNFTCNQLMDEQIMNHKDDHGSRIFLTFSDSFSSQKHGFASQPGKLALRIFASIYNGFVMFWRRSPKFKNRIQVLLCAPLHQFDWFGR